MDVRPITLTSVDPGTKETRYQFGGLVVVEGCLEARWELSQLEELFALVSDLSGQPPCAFPMTQLQLLRQLRDMFEP